MERFIR